MRGAERQQRFEFCQRWTKGREFYRPAGEPIRVTEFGVERISDSESKVFVADHHYAPNSPPQILSMGLFRKTGVRRSRLVGVCRFSVPMNQRAIPKHTGQAPRNGCELGRLVLLDEIAANGESFFVARALKGLAAEKPHIHAVVSYCDPMPRHRADGTAFKRGHIGTCYQALNARHVGRAKPRTLLMTRDGQVISERALSKLRNDESGSAYVYRQLLSAGCQRRKAGEATTDYLERAIKEGGLRKTRHPGNLVYSWAIGGPRNRRTRQQQLPEALPYPKLELRK
jgi:hypothetical protein